MPKILTAELDEIKSFAEPLPHGLSDFTHAQLAELALSKSNSDKAQFVQIIDKLAPEVAAAGAKILAEGLKPVLFSKRMLSRTIPGGYRLEQGLTVFLAQLYNHCKLQLPTRLKGTTVRRSS